MTMGQHVPAIYFNDLFGQLNDSDGYRLSGKPRDLNRKKLVLDESGLITGSDDFLKHYLPLLDSMISIRTSDPAFFPGSPKFEELAVSNKVFVHHAFHDRHDSVIIGNISSASQDLDFSKNFSALIPPEDADDFSDALTGKPLISVLADNGKLTMTPYYAYYLQKRGGL
jgi:hypothetical protein